MVIKSLEMYNSGHSMERISSVLEMEFNNSVPRRTLYSWLRRYEQEYGTYLLRRSYGKRFGSPIIRHSISMEYPFSLHFKKIVTKYREAPCLFHHIERLLKDQDVKFGNVEPGKRDIILGRHLLGTWSERTIELLRLSKRGRKGRTKSDLMEFMLLNHPDCVCTGFPLGNMDSVVTGSIDIVLVDKGMVHLVDVSSSDIPDERRKRALSKKTGEFIDITGCRPDEVTCWIIFENDLLPVN
jgi:hypothetical protein